MRAGRLVTLDLARATLTRRWNTRHGPGGRPPDHVDHAGQESERGRSEEIGRRSHPPTLAHALLSSTGVPTPNEHLATVNRIVGVNVTDPTATINLTWNDRSQGQAHLRSIRQKQKELKLLKREIGATVSALKSEFTTARTAVGKSFGAGLAAGFFGRKTMGRVNAGRRDDLRRQQHQTVAPYEHLKLVIDRVVAALDSIKGQIELSPSYQARAAGQKMLT